MTAAADGGDGAVGAKAQQSPLASQRAQDGAAAQSTPATTNNRGGLFPLSYKEGFSQWV